MKNIISTLVLSVICSAAHAGDSIEFSGTLQNDSSRDAVVAFYSEYEATSSLPGCKRYGIPDGDFQSDFKTKQRLQFIQGAKFRESIEAEFGFCNYKLRSAGVVVVDSAIINNLEKMGAEEVEDGIYEFKGGLSNLVRVKGGHQAKANALNCTFAEGFAAKCDLNEIISKGDSILVSIKVK